MTTKVVTRNGRRVVVRTYQPTKLPDKPKVTEGPRSYGRTKRGGYIVPRFWITRNRPGERTNRWFVIDMEETSQYVAKGTKESGYPDRGTAIEKAREYRDKYGAWYVMPF